MTTAPADPARPATPARGPGQPSAAQVVLAARVTAGVIGAGLLGVGVYAARTVSRLVRS